MYTHKQLLVPQNQGREESHACVFLFPTSAEEDKRTKRECLHVLMNSWVDLPSMKDEDRSQM